jgi:hypothetical protein
VRAHHADVVASDEEVRHALFGTTIAQRVEASRHGVSVMARVAIGIGPSVTCMAPGVTAMARGVASIPPGVIAMARGVASLPRAAMRPTLGVTLVPRQTGSTSP